MKIINDDCIEAMKQMKDNSVDSIVTDPPYELGFMGKKWDSTGIANNKEMWAECLRVLKPGGHLLAFSGTRTYHRMAVAIEDAGFEVRDMIEWIYASGFPKSLNIGKAVDKLQGNEREVVGHNTNTAPDLRDVGAMSKKATGIDKLSFGQNPRPAYRKQIEITKGSSEYEGWGTATKPSHEPIAFCSKPLTVELIFAKMGIDITNNLLNLCQKYNVNVKDVESSLNSILLKLKAVGVNTVAENARMCEWENIESAVIVAINSMSQKHTLKEKTEESKEVSAQINVKENGKNDLQEKPIQTGKADNLREQMATLQTMLATGIIDLNTILLWKELLEGVLEKARMFTISTALEMTTGLKTCNFLLLANTQSYTKQNEIRPNHEPICMARKPLAEKTVAENCLKWGTGGINIDESRVWTEDKMSYSSSEKQGVTQFGTGTTEQSPLGRFPANLIHDNSEEVRECFPETKSAGGLTKNVPDSASVYGKYGVVETMKPTDSGNASRFFKSIIYQPKASKSERNKGCEGMETKTAMELTGRKEGSKGLSGSKEHGNSTNPYANSGSVLPRANHHPTVKPIALMEYLINMVTPKGGIVLDPFMGSGSTGVAAIQNGFDFIGIDMTPEYVEIATARLTNIENNLIL